MAMISSDAFIESAAKEQGKPYHEVFASEIKSATIAAQKKFDTLLHVNVDMIIDKTNLTVASRAKWMANNHKKICFVWSPRKTIGQCVERAKSGDHIIDQKIIINMFKGYQEPTLDEGFDQIYFIS
jgi:hypothetical protein